ncbi:UvrD-helicase domain-containing protein [Sphingomonas sp.]|jgi:superfamily I DNA/RNA helicase|uniref:UvrD-helicase domain-containing protein n=1 Tax=Sphingomonas sp. TaxID=28214 RepID=UPI002E348407|nr:UvrD-helicase domain-containing protein [Sphingomonas sp.]HEX4694206.1 UvrD-helicase domain-containing protein [Sphingomonas sp.]
MNETWWVNSGQLDADQKNVLKADIDESLLIKGPPGSGKTNILLLRANYVRSKAPRILFITFTRTLAEFIKSGPSIGRADQIQATEIKTFMGWGKGFLRDSGEVFADPKTTFVASRAALITALSEYISNNNPGKIYDSVFVDEVQDFKEAELDILARLSETVNSAGDSRQAIWEHNEGLPAMEALATSIVDLKKHYRIGLKICQFADRILPPPLGAPPMAKDCAYDESARPSSVTSIECTGDHDQWLRCLEEVKRQIRYISDEPILVLSQTGAARDAFWAELVADGELLPKALLQASDNYEAFGPDSLVRVMTIASAKGSEARAVHILRADGLTTGLRELAFTAVTRAKTEVTLYYNSILPGHLQSPEDVLPEIDSLF